MADTVECGAARPPHGGGCVNVLVLAGGLVLSVAVGVVATRGMLGVLLPPPQRREADRRTRKP